MPVQIFWASPKIWLHLVPLQKLLCRHKNQFYWMQIIFLSGTKCFWLAQSPSQSASTILKNRAPCFLKNGAPCFLQKAGWKKQGHSLFKKRRDQAASSLFELQWPWFFALCFFQKAGCPIFKNSGCRLTGRICRWLSSARQKLSQLKSHVTPYKLTPLIGWNYSIQTGKQIL